MAKSTSCAGVPPIGARPRFARRQTRHRHRPAPPRLVGDHAERGAAHRSDIGPGLGHGRHPELARTRDDRHHQRNIVQIAGERSDLGATVVALSHPGEVARRGYESVRRFEADDAAPRGRQPHASTGIAADADDRPTRGGGNRFPRARSARRSMRGQQSEARSTICSPAFMPITVTWSGEGSRVVSDPSSAMTEKSPPSTTRSMPSDVVPEPTV